MLTLPFPKPDTEFVVVPSEPTIEMLNAYDAARAATTMTANGMETYNPHQSYWALLKAAPPDDAYKRLLKIEAAALALSTAMVENEAKGADFELVDEEWMLLTAALQQNRKHNL